MTHTISPTPMLLSRRRLVGLCGAAATATILTACQGESESQSGGGHAGGETVAQSPPDYAARFAHFEPADAPDGDLAMVDWPDFVLTSPPEVQDLYAFHVTNGGLMRFMPCFCGCNGGSGHRNNRDCYIDTVHPDGSVTFDAMAPT
jgi:hypothetical protein